MKRRTFLSNSGKAALISPIAVSGVLDQDFLTERKTKKVGYAFIGLGFFASYVAPRIDSSKHSKIVALVSSERKKALEWASKYDIKKKNIYNYDNMDSMVNNDEIDAVYIATPVGTHCEFALRAFKARKHVITEKTMAASILQGKQMIEAAEKAGKKLMVAYRVRYEPYNQQAIKMSKEKTYGEVNSIAAHKGFFIGDKLGKNDWRTSKNLAGGGALVDIGIYSVQAIRYLSGAEPIEVCGFDHSTAGDRRFEEVEENLSFMIRFNSGILATGSASWNYAHQNYFRVGATGGYYQLEPATSNGNIRMTIKETDPTFIGERFFKDVDQIPLMFDHFSECIQKNREPLTNGAEGLKDLKVIEAIYEAITTKTVIKM